jgi:Flp pilus assembly protein TadD
VGILGLNLFFGIAYGEETLASAQALLKQNKAREALAILLSLQAGAPSDANVCQQIGIAYTQLEDLPQAERFYREAVRLNPQFWAARKNLGTVLWFLNRKDESEFEFLAVAKALPADPVPHLYLGLAAHSRLEFQHAKRQFEQASGLAFANPEVFPAVLESYLATRDLAFPQQFAEQLTAAGPEVLSDAGRLFLQYGYADRASAALEKLVSVRSDSAENWRMLAQAYDRQGKPELAYQSYSRAIDADASAEDSYIALAEFASTHGNNDYGLQVLARGLLRLPKSPVMRFEQGVLWAMKGDRSLAESCFQQAHSVKPGWSLPLLALGVTHLESGDVSQAATLFQKARNLDPQDARAHYLYATALFKTGEGISPEARKEAVAALHKAIELNPNEGRSHALLGQFQLADGYAEAASREWRTALEIEPDNLTALYQLALLYRKQGKTDEARRLLDTFQRAKASQRSDEQSLVQILRVVPGAQAR